MSRVSICDLEILGVLAAALRGVTSAQLRKLNYKDIFRTRKQ